jgi:hypothetical protein
VVLERLRREAQRLEKSIKVLPKYSKPEINKFKTPSVLFACQSFQTIQDSAFGWGLTLSAFSGMT